MARKNGTARDGIYKRTDLKKAARYQHMSPGFLAEALGRLDAVFGEVRYPDLTNEKALTSGEPISA
jgi:hypothetical protein